MKNDKKSMGNIEMPKARQLSKKELMERAYKQKWRELKIAKMRAAVLKNQIARAYEILENIRFDFLGDTMFRDYFTKAKRQLEGAMSDYLLSAGCWEKQIGEHRKMSPLAYAKKVSTPAQPTEGKGQK